MNHKELDAMPAGPPARAKRRTGRQVWKNAMLLAELVYKQTKDFPAHEQFGLSSQLRRAALSVPSNAMPTGPPARAKRRTGRQVAEGAARKGNKEFIHFLYISLGSLAELET